MAGVGAAGEVAIPLLPIVAPAVAPASVAAAAARAIAEDGDFELRSIPDFLPSRVPTPPAASIVGCELTALRRSPPRSFPRFFFNTPPVARLFILETMPAAVRERLHGLMAARRSELFSV